MIRTVTAVALVLSHIVVGSAYAQNDRFEFDRVSGGEVSAIAKGARPFSGSLSLTHSLGSFGSGGIRGYGATLGGSIGRDRVWFFASMESHKPLIASSYAVEPVNTSAAKMIANLGERQNLAASYVGSVLRAPDFAAAIPSTFLSLRYTAIVTDSMFVTASVSQRRAD